MSRTPLEAIGEKLVGPRYSSYLDETVVRIGADSWSRRQILQLEVPHHRALKNVERACQRAHIRDSKHLFAVGLQGLANVSGVGDATLVDASILLYDAGFDVDKWIASTGMRTLKGAAREASRKGKKRRHE